MPGKQSILRLAAKAAAASRAIAMITRHRDATCICLRRTFISPASASSCAMRRERLRWAMEMRARAFRMRAWFSHCH